MKHTDLMIDIETLSLSTRGVMIQLGAVSFNIEDADGESDAGLSLVIPVRSQIPLGRTIDASTLSWWMDQVRENPALCSVLGAAFSSTADLQTRLEEAFGWMSDHSQMTRVWAVHPEFDIGLIKDLCMQLEIRWPWNYRAVRDVGTYNDGVRGLYTEDSRPWRERRPAHDALEDCFAQVEWLRSIYREGLE